MEEIDESSQGEVQEFKGFQKVDIKPDNTKELSAEKEEKEKIEAMPNGTGNDF